MKEISRLSPEDTPVRQSKVIAGSSSVRDDIVVRHEAFGPLIWSRTLRKYFLPKNASSLQLLESWLKGLEQNDAISRVIPATFRQEALHLGLGGRIRQLWSSFPDAAPCDAYFDYTFTCNQSCSYCYNQFAQRTPGLTVSEIEHILTELCHHGVMRLHLSGGEPLLYPEKLATYIQVADRLGMLLSVNTNGTLLTPDLCGLLFQDPVLSITVSLDSHQAFFHDCLREAGTGSFDRAVVGLRTALRATAQASSRTCIKVKSVWGPCTPIDTFRGLAHLCSDMGITQLKFSCPEKSVYHPRGYYGTRVFASAYYERVRLISQLQTEFVSQLRIRNVANPFALCGKIGLPGAKGCIGGQELIAILPDGSIQPCAMNPYKFGNIFSDYGGDFETFLRSEKRQVFLSKIRRSTCSACENCLVYSFCRGGCKVRAIVETGGLSGRDPLCPKATMSFNRIPQHMMQDSEIDELDLIHFMPLSIVHSL